MLNNRKPSPSAHRFNAEGFPTYNRTPQEDYLRVLLTNTLGGTFYANPQELLTESLDLHQTMTTLVPEFAARAIVYARREGFMRQQPIIGLAHLSAHAPALFEQIFAQVILTPHDLAQFIGVLRGEHAPVRLNRRQKRAANNWLNQMSEYHAIKYANNGKKDYALRDIMRLTHPVPIDNKQAAIFAWLTRPDHWRTEHDPDLTPQITAFESLKALASAPKSNVQQSAMIPLIESGKLPHEVITGLLSPSARMWKTLMYQMPLTA